MHACSLLLCHCTNLLWYICSNSGYNHFLVLVNIFFGLLCDCISLKIVLLSQTRWYWKFLTSCLYYSCRYYCYWCCFCSSCCHYWWLLVVGFCFLSHDDGDQYGRVTVKLNMLWKTKDWLFLFVAELFIFETLLAHKRTQLT